VLNTLPGLREDGRGTGDDFGHHAVPDLDEGSETLRIMLESLVSPTPVSVNALAREASAPVSAVLAALMEMALAGRVELAPGNLVIGL